MPSYRRQFDEKVRDESEIPEPDLSQGFPSCLIATPQPLTTMTQIRTASRTSIFLARGLVAALLAGTFIPLLPAYADPLTTNEIDGKVLRVVDGDTLIVLTSTGTKMTLRLAGIDAPEKSMPYGDSARNTLIDLVGSGEITIQTTKTDRYGRAIGKVFGQNGDVNLALIKRGMAWHYKRYAHEQSPKDAEAYASAERDANKSEVGLWHDPNPMPPWRYRQCRKTQSDCIATETSADSAEEKSSVRP